MSDQTGGGYGPTTDPTDFPPPPVSPDGYSPPSDDVTSNGDQTSDQSDPTDFSDGSGGAAAYDNAGDNTFGTQENRRSYSDPTDFTSSQQPAASSQPSSDAAATDQSNAQQVSAPIPTSDPTDFTQEQPAASDPTDFTNREERSASLQTPQFTPSESGRVANAESGYFTAENQQKETAASFGGENADLTTRAQQLQDAMDNGTATQDDVDRFNEDATDFSQRLGDWQQRAPGYLNDAANNVGDTLASIQSARATDASNLTQAANDTVGQFRTDPYGVPENLRQTLGLPDNASLDSTFEENFSRANQASGQAYDDALRQYTGGGTSPASDYVSTIQSAAADPATRGFYSTDGNTWQPFTQDDAATIQQRANAGEIKVISNTPTDVQNILANAPRPGGLENPSAGKVAGTLAFATAGLGAALGGPLIASDLVANFPEAASILGRTVTAAQRTYGAVEVGKSLWNGPQQIDTNQLIDGFVNIAASKFTGAAAKTLAEWAGAGAADYSLGIIAPEFRSLVTPAVEGGAPLLTRPTLGQVIGFALVNGANIPFTNTPIPGTGEGVLQHPVGAIVDVAERLKQAITSGTLVKAATSRADWENAVTSIQQSLSQSEEVYARQQGLQQMIGQVDPLLGAGWKSQSTVTLANLILPNAIAAIKGEGGSGTFFGDPFAAFSAQMQANIQKGMPAPQAAAAAFTSNSNGINNALWAFNARNPLWNWMHSPAIERAMQGMFSGFGTQIANPDAFLAGVVPTEYSKLDPRFYIGASKASIQAQTSRAFGDKLTSAVPHDPAQWKDALLELYTGAATGVNNPALADRTYQYLGERYGTLAPNGFQTPEGTWRAFGQTMQDGVLANQLAGRNTGTFQDVMKAHMDAIDSLASGGQLTPLAQRSLESVQQKLGNWHDFSDGAQRYYAALELPKGLLDAGVAHQLGVPVVRDVGAIRATVERGLNFLRAAEIFNATPGLAGIKFIDEDLRAGARGFDRPGPATMTRVSALSGTETMPARLFAQGIAVPGVASDVPRNNLPVQPAFRGTEWQGEKNPIMRVFNGVNEALSRTTNHATRQVYMEASEQSLAQALAAHPDTVYADVFRAFRMNGGSENDARLWAERARDLATRVNPSDPTKYVHFDDLARQMLAAAPAVQPTVPVAGMAQGAPWAPSPRVQDNIAAQGAPGSVRAAQNARGSGAPLDVAAGDGGAGYTSGRFNAVRGVDRTDFSLPDFPGRPNILTGQGSDFGDFGTVRGKGANYGSAPRGERWRSDFASQLAGRVDNGEVTAQDFRDFAQLAREGRIAPTAANYERLKDLGQVASLRREIPGFAEAYQELHDARLGQFAAGHAPDPAFTRAEPPGLSIDAGMQDLRGRVGWTDERLRANPDAANRPLTPQERLDQVFEGRRITPDAPLSVTPESRGRLGRAIQEAENAPTDEALGEATQQPIAVRQLNVPDPTDFTQPAAPTIERGIGERLRTARDILGEKFGGGSERQVSGFSGGAGDVDATPEQLQAFEDYLRSLPSQSVQYPPGAASPLQLAPTSFPPPVATGPNWQNVATGGGGGFGTINRGGFAGAPGTLPSAGNPFGEGAAAVRAAGEQRTAMLQGAAGAGYQGIRNTIGDFAIRTPLSEFAKWVYPFSEFHVNSIRVNATNMASNPVWAAYLGAYILNNEDDYGRLPVTPGLVANLGRLFTGAHLIGATNTQMQGAQQNLGNPNNNPWQQAQKIGTRLFAGPQSPLPGPYSWWGLGAQALAAKTTSPNTNAKGQVDFADQLRAYAPGQGWAAAGANWLVDHLPIPQDVKDKLRPGINYGLDPASTVDLLIRQGVVKGLNELPGRQIDLTMPNQQLALQRFTGQFAQDSQWPTVRAQNALRDVMENRLTPDGALLKSAFNLSQDQGNLAKNAPIQFASTAPGAKPIYPPDNAQTFFDKRNFAGEGDRGVRVPDGKGGYFDETPDQRAYTTARAQLALPPSLESAPASDYARMYLQGTGYQPTATRTPDNAGSSARFDRSQAALTGQIAGNATRTGAGLPQEQRTALLGAVGTELAPGFTTADLINQPGNVRDLIRQYEQAKAAGASQTELRAISGRINDAQAADLAQFPQTKGYFDFENAQRGYTPGEPPGYATWGQNQKDAWDAFNNLRSSPDYKRYQELQAAQAAAGPFGSPQEKAWYTTNRNELTKLQGVISGAEQSIVDRFGINPRELANKIATDAGRAPTYQTTEIKAPSSMSSTSSRGTGSTSSSSSRAPYRPSGTSSSYRGGTSPRSSGTGGSSLAGSQQAGNDFYDFYRTLTSSQDKATVLSALDKADVNPIGQKSVAAATYERALAVAKDALNQRHAAQGAPGQQRDLPYQYEFYRPSAQDLDLLVRGVVPDSLASLGRPGASGATGSSGTPTRASNGVPYAGGTPYPTSTNQTAPNRTYANQNAPRASRVPYPGSKKSAA